MLNKMCFSQYYAEGDVCNTGLVSLAYETRFEGSLFIRIIHYTCIFGESTMGSTKADKASSKTR